MLFQEAVDNSLHCRQRFALIPPRTPKSRVFREEEADKLPRVVRQRLVLRRPTVAVAVRLRRTRQRAVVHVVAVRTLIFRYIVLVLVYPEHFGPLGVLVEIFARAAGKEVPGSLPDSILHQKAHDSCRKRAPVRLSATHLCYQLQLIQIVSVQKRRPIRITASRRH